MNLLHEIRQLFEPVLQATAPDAAKVPDYLGMVKAVADAKNGDYQANFAMPLAKVLGRKPQELAQEFLGKLPANDLLDSATVAGPGFINLKLKAEWIAERVRTIAADERLGVSFAKTPRTFVIDLSGPNVAKPLHVGHLRSTIIGDSLVRILRFSGHTVIGDNHLGDWGTQFGILIHGYKNFRDEAAYAADPVRELARLYVLIRQMAKASDDEDEGTGEIMDACRKETAKLHAGDAENVALWKQFMPHSLKMLMPIYYRLGLTITNAFGMEFEDRIQPDFAERTKTKTEVALGESFYNPSLPGIVTDLLAKGVAVKSEGAVVVPNALGIVWPYGGLAGEEVNDSDIANESAYTSTGDSSETFVSQLLNWAKLYSDGLAQNPIVANVANSHFQRLLARGTPHQITEAKKRLSQKSLGGPLDYCGLALQLISNDKLEPPALIQKRDGAFTYTTTDFATIQYRTETWHPDVMLYVVDARQALHFKTLFANARRWGYDGVEFDHVQFGSILGRDKRPLKTRDGGTIELDSLLDEAMSRAKEKYQANSTDRRERGQDVPELNDGELANLTAVVGIGAVKYADLSNHRTTDYIFDYDKMLATEGNTATYMQYAYARCRSILRKGDVDPTAFRTNPPAVELVEPAERNLALQLLKFEETLEATAAEYLPHYIAGYLWDLAKALSTFYEACPVLTAASPELKASRLLLVDLTGRTIHQALNLLGIHTVERM